VCQCRSPSPRASWNSRTPTRHRHRHPREDPRKDVRVSGESARMSVSVLASWNASCTTCYGHHHEENWSRGIPAIWACQHNTQPLIAIEMLRKCPVALIFFPCIIGLGIMICLRYEYGPTVFRRFKPIVRVYNYAQANKRCLARQLKATDRFYLHVLFHYRCVFFLLRSACTCVAAHGGAVRCGPLRTIDYRYSYTFNCWSGLLHLA